MGSLPISVSVFRGVAGGQCTRDGDLSLASRDTEFDSSHLDASESAVEVGPHPANFLVRGVS